MEYALVATKNVAYSAFLDVSRRCQRQRRLPHPRAWVFKCCGEAFTVLETRFVDPRARRNNGTRRCRCLGGLLTWPSPSSATHAAAARGSRWAARSPTVRGRLIAERQDVLRSGQPQGFEVCAAHGRQDHVPIFCHAEFAIPRDFVLLRVAFLEEKRIGGELRLVIANPVA